MHFDFSTLMELLLSAITGGGIACLFTIPEKKKAAKLENTSKIIADYERYNNQLKNDLQEADKRIDALQQRVDELYKQSRDALAERDDTIQKLQKRVFELENELEKFRKNAASKKPKSKSNGNKNRQKVEEK